MKYAFAAIAALGLASNAQAGLNDHLPPEAYVDPIDQQIARTGVGLPGRPGPCLTEEVTNGIKVIVGKPPERCVKMLPAQRFRGIWYASFEGSTFCPEPTETCIGDKAGERIWLSGGPGKLRGAVYRVDFIGRKTMYKGPYGHGNVSDHEIVMDQAIKIELISKPLMPSKETIEYLKKKCEAKPTCDMKNLTETWRLEYRSDHE
jgi:hypothetical protein